MKKLVIEFSFPNKYDYTEVLSVITEGICDQDKELADKTEYVVREVKVNA